jgi:hypothetical protein
MCRNVINVRMNVLHVTEKTIVPVAIVMDSYPTNKIKLVKLNVKIIFFQTITIVKNAMKIV